MKRVLRSLWLLLVICALGALAVPAAHSGCGDSYDGTWNSAGLSCGGAAANCTSITVCPPKK